MTDTWNLAAKVATWRFRCQFCNGEIPKGKWHEKCMNKALKEWRAEE